jgi:hypothetical protein
MVRRSIAVVVASCVVGSLAVAGSAQAAGPVFFGKAAVGATVSSVSWTNTWGPWFIEAAGGTKLTCKAGLGSGELTGATTVANVGIQLTGCEVGGIPCENGVAGEVLSNTLAGSLGNVTTTTPGVRFFSQAEGKGGVLAEYTCAGGSIKVTWKGSIIGALSGSSGKTVAEGKLATSSKLTYAASQGIQRYKKFLPGEGEAGEEQIEQNSGAGFEDLGINAIATIKTTPAGEFGITK